MVGVQLIVIFTYLILCYSDYSLYSSITIVKMGT